MQEYVQSLLDTGCSLLEEGIFLLFDIISKAIKGRTNLRFFNIGAIVNAHQKHLIKSSEFIDIQLILKVSEISKDYVVSQVHPLISDIEVDLITFVNQLQLLGGDCALC